MPAAPAFPLRNLLGFTQGLGLPDVVHWAGTGQGVRTRVVPEVGVLYWLVLWEEQGATPAPRHPARRGRRRAAGALCEACAVGESLRLTVAWETAPTASAVWA